MELKCFSCGKKKLKASTSTRCFAKFASLNFAKRRLRVAFFFSQCVNDVSYPHSSVTVAAHYLRTFTKWRLFHT